MKDSLPACFLMSRSAIDEILRMIAVNSVGYIPRSHNTYLHDPAQNAVIALALGGRLVNGQGRNDFRPLHIAVSKQVRVHGSGHYKL
jgi:hypothetical protein